MSLLETEPWTLADAALEYAEAGWPIFPLKPRSKEPLTDHGFKDATTDIEQVRRWWHEWPSANIGVQTGVLFDVIDVDGTAGFDTLQRLVARHGPLEAGAIAATPGKVRDGAHVGTGAHYFVAVTGLPSSRASDFGPNVEMKAAGGYVVLPPSVHPDGTGAYEWALRPEQRVPFPAAPDWVYEPSRRKEAARLAELVAREERRRLRPATSDSVMDRFNANASWRELLEAEGWTYSHTHGDNEYWCRPGKTTREGHSASINDQGDGCLYVFSTDASPFEDGKAYSKFAAYAILRHRGDFSRAARTIAAWWKEAA